MPRPLWWGLLLAWLNLAISAGFRMWWMIATNVPAEMVTTDTIMPVLTVSVVMLFTPTFLGNWIFAVLLVLIMRRHAWPRWVLLAGGVISLFFFARSLMSGVTDDILLRVGMYVLYFAALTMMFLRESSAWFRS